MSKVIKVSDEIFDKQLEHLPKDVKFCKKCVVSNQRPRIKWDIKEEGFALHVTMHMKKTMKSIGVSERENYKRFVTHIAPKTDLGM